MNGKIVAVVILLGVTLVGLYASGVFEPQTKTLIKHHDDGFHIVMTPVEGMPADTLADNIHAGQYNSIKTIDGVMDCANEGIPVSSYVVYEDYRDYYEGTKNVVAQGGKALIKYEWGYSPLDYEDGTVQVTTLENVTIEII